MTELTQLPQTTQKTQSRLVDRFSYDQRYQWTLVIIISSLCFITFVPLLWVILTSVKPNSEIYTTTLHVLPKESTMEHYAEIFEKGDQLPTYLYNTVIYAISSIAIITVFGSMAGYVLARIKFFGAGIILNSFLMILSLPWVVLMVPILLFEFKLGIWNTRLGVILPYVALFLPIGIWIMRGTFLSMPPELGEAARIDGASEFSVFSRVYLPMARGGIATVIILLFIDVWNEVLFASTFVRNSRLANINVGVRLLADEGQSFAFGTLSAVIILSMIPTLAVFIVLQRYYIKGISEGALAGF